LASRKPDLVAGVLPPVPLSDNASARVRRAKIICTIGPASDSEACIRDLMQLGMDVARLNFSHGTHAEHARRINRLRRAARRLKRTLCILQDLQGPKIRTGRLKGGQPVMLESGARLTITPRAVAGIAALISTDFPGLAREIEPGARILLSDGRIELKVIAIHGADVECEVLNGGVLAEQQGINLPGAALSIQRSAEKDIGRSEIWPATRRGCCCALVPRSADDIRNG
jgi:pyruvate kinase